MERIEIEGKSIDDAIEKACSAFLVPREKLNIEIIAAGNPGFLGLGANKARIRAGLLSIDMALDDVFSRVETPTPVRMEKSAAPTLEGNRAGIRAVDNGTQSAAPVPKGRPAVHPAATAPAAITKTPEPMEQRVTARPNPAAADRDGEPAAEKARRLLEGILTRMQISSPVDVEETEEAIILNIRGDGSGLLIGKRGQNLDAIQYIVNKAVHHSANGHKMIVIDTEEYRKRREESLVALAMRLGEKVRKTKKPVTVGHMNAHDRRVIHMAMQDDETLTTKSRGEGEYRKIVILPARRGPDRADA
ncbi:MAG: RNA-binding cell elongation regulator Jag/EloR [Syntrophales bacterium]|nr:RNA-binding cell elongation regulator Jag/EloR [Syntrophales bacterium]MDP3096927.1 RNA-binding cell elongation regulator Jag/EloR [Syntrophales bacterium]